MRVSPLFSNIETGENSASYDEVEHASYKGITIKSLILLAIVLAVGILTAILLPKMLTGEGSAAGYYVGVVFAIIIGSISVIVGRISSRAAKVSSVIYSICEGFLLGTISRILEEYIPGIATAAIFGTTIIFAVMLILFGTGIIKAGNGVLVFLISLALSAFALSLFTIIYCLVANIDTTTYLGLLILIEAIYLVYGCVMLTLNFMEASNVVKSGASKNAEWSVALGIEVSLIYIYIELLRILLYVAALFGKNN